MDATRQILRARAVAVATSVSRNRPRLQASAILGSVASSLAGALFLCSAWLLLRRLTGAFKSPLDGRILLTVGSCAVLAAAASRLLWRRTADESSASARRLRDWLPTVSLVLFATSAAVPGSSVVAVGLLWIMIVAEEVAAAWLGRMPDGQARRNSIAGKRRAGKEFKRGHSPSVIGGGSAEISSDVWQHHTRQRTADGREFAHGTLRTSFVAGQRTAIEHLVFCPMLAAAPRITAVALDELDCAVRATHVYRYGARLEIRLREPCDEPLEMLVRYEARV